MWAESSVFYQIYPLGFCGAPKENDGVTVNRLDKVSEWIPHLLNLNINAVYFSPVFESDRHGYDTRDYRKIDCRLGTNEDFARLCRELKKNRIKIVLDGVFNHVGRGFWAFEDVRKNREASKYKDWFYLDFKGNTGYNDGFYYESWEGHYELVKLNLDHEAVVDHLFEAVKFWVENFDIDGLRLDVAYCLNEAFIRKLRSFTEGLKPDFYLIGEVLFGDYNRLVNDLMLHSCTNYECYKGLYSSFNDRNLFEIAHSLDRQFGSEAHSLYRGKHLLGFVDNHDVSRVASILTDKEHLRLIYAVLFAMPGIPCIYYGSEWGAKGDKKDGDDALRQEYHEPEFNELGSLIAKLSKIKKESSVLNYGSYRHIVLTNRQLVIQRELNQEIILIAVNADEREYFASFHLGFSRAFDMFSGEEEDISSGFPLEAYSFRYLKVQNG